MKDIVRCVNDVSCMDSRMFLLLCSSCCLKVEKVEELSKMNTVS